MFSLYSNTLSISDDYVSYTGYWSFYEAESGVNTATGSTATLTSRLIDRDVVANYTVVREAVEIIGGGPEYTYNTFHIVVEESADRTSGLNPAWRSSNYVVTVGRGVAYNASQG